MALIDTSIYAQNQAPNALATFFAANQAGSAIRENREARADRATERENKLALQSAYKNALGPDGAIDENKLVKYLAEQGQGIAIPGIQKSFADQRKAQAEAQAKQFENTTKRLDWARNGIASATDPKAAQAYIASGVVEGLLTPEQAERELSGIPESPSDFAEWRKVRENSLMTAAQRADAIAKERGYQFDREKFGYQQTNDAAQRGVQLRGQDITRQGQIESDRRRADLVGQAKTPSGYRQRSDGGLEFIPGGPADPAAAKRAAPTEDERKAAGWLAQARNAYKNMEDAIKVNPKAAEVGFVEAYSPVDEVANRSRSPERQRYAQAASSFAEAALRAATGAGVTESEAKQKIAELTPQRGDSEAVRQQKRDGLLVYLDSLEARSGRAGTAAAPTTVIQPIVVDW